MLKELCKVSKRSYLLSTAKENSHLIDRCAPSLFDKKKAIVIIRVGMDKDEDLAIF